METSLWIFKAFRLHYFLGTAGIKDDLIIGKGSSDISAGGGNDTIIPELGPRVP